MNRLIIINQENFSLEDQENFGKVGNTIKAGVASLALLTSPVTGKVIGKVAAKPSSIKIIKSIKKPEFKANQIDDTLLNMRESKKVVPPGYIDEDLHELKIKNLSTKDKKYVDSLTKSGYFDWITGWKLGSKADAIPNIYNPTEIRIETKLSKRRKELREIYRRMDK